MEKVANDAKSGNGLDSEAPKDADAGGNENKAAVLEQRMAPDGSGKYTKEEFVEYYGGTAEWDAAVGTNTAASSEPTISFGSLMKQISEEWKSKISAKEKDKYEKIAAVENMKYRREFSEMKRREFLARKEARLKKRAGIRKQRRKRWK